MIAKIILSILFEMLFFVTVVFSANNEPINTLPDSTSSFMSTGRTYWRDELANVLGRYFTHGWIDSGGTFTWQQTQGVISPSFSTTAFTSAGKRITANGSGGAAAITFDANVGCSSTDTAWVIISGQTGNTLSQFQRSGTSNYFVDCVTTTQPTLPSDSAWLVRVTIVSSAITDVRPLTCPFPVNPASIGIAHHVRCYGAIVDDSIDDTVQIQQALTDAASSRGQVMLDEGTYNVSSDLTVTAATTIQGRGEGTIIQRSTGTAGGGVYGFDVRSNNVTIRDLRFNIIVSSGAPTTGWDINAINALSTVDGDNLTIENFVGVATKNTVLSADSGFRCIGIFGPGNQTNTLVKVNAVVRGNRCENFNRGIEISRVRNVIATDNIMLNMAEIAIAVQYDNGMQISNNVVRWTDSVTNPVTSVAHFGIYATSSATEVGLGDSSIANNTLNAVERCIILQGAARILVSGNQCRGDGDGTAINLTSGGFILNQQNMITNNLLSNFTTAFSFAAGDGGNVFAFNMYDSSMSVPAVGSRGTNVVGPNIIRDILPGRSLWVGDALSMESPPPIWVEVGNLIGNAALFIGQLATRGLHLGWEYNATVASAYALIQSWGGGNNLVLQRDGGGVSIGTTTAPVTTGGLSITGAGQLGTTDVAGLSASPYSTAPAGTIVGCTNCTKGSSPCSGASTGALAYRRSAQWEC